VRAAAETGVLPNPAASAAAPPSQLRRSIVIHASPTYVGGTMIGKDSKHNPLPTLPSSSAEWLCPQSHGSG
jgi:hypothetical protein